MLAVLCTLLISASSDAAPPIGRGLPKSFGPTPEFDRRIQQRFTIGSDDSRLLAELRGEGFTIVELHDPQNRDRIAASYEIRLFPCKESWTVQWTAKQGRITGIDGTYSGELCL